MILSLYNLINMATRKIGTGKCKGLTGVKLKSCNRKGWEKGKTGFEGTKLEDRHRWMKKDNTSRLFVHKNASEKKYYVGYKNISNPNQVQLANDVSKNKAMTIAKSYMENN